MQQQYDVTFTLPLLLAASSPTAAEAQADILIANSTTLAAAVTAGLISGEMQMIFG